MSWEKKIWVEPGIVAPTYNPCSEAEAGELLQVKVRLAYILSSRPVSTGTGRLCLKIKQKPNNNKTKSVIKTVLVKETKLKLQVFCLLAVV